MSSVFNVRRMSAAKSGRPGGDGDHLGIDDRGPGRQVRQSVGDSWKALGESLPLREWIVISFAVLVELHAVAVEFDLVQPIAALGWAITQGGIGRDDERRGTHGHNLAMWQRKTRGCTELRRLAERLRQEYLWGTPEHAARR